MIEISCCQVLLFIVCILVDISFSCSLFKPCLVNVLLLMSLKNLIYLLFLTEICTRNLPLRGPLHHVDLKTLVRSKKFWITKFGIWAILITLEYFLSFSEDIWGQQKLMALFSEQGCSTPIKHPGISQHLKHPMVWVMWSKSIFEWFYIFTPNNKL